MSLKNTQILPSFVFKDSTKDVLVLNENIYSKYFETFFTILLDFSKHINSKEIFVESILAVQNSNKRVFEGSLDLTLNKHPEQTQNFKSLFFDIDPINIFDNFYVWMKYYDVHNSVLLLGNVIKFTSSCLSWELYIDRSYEVALLGFQNNIHETFNNYLNVKSINLLEM